MSDSNKANEDVLNSLHFMVAGHIVKLLKDAKDDPELLLKVLREARGFLKDNSVIADVSSPRLEHIESEVKISELPFKVKEE